MNIGTPREMELRPFKEWVPWLLPTIFVANIVVFGITMYINDCPKNERIYYHKSCFCGFLGRFSFQPLKENPLLCPSSLTLEKMGALELEKVVHQNQAWRLITSMWLHTGVVHVFANMISLVFIGLSIEREFGFVKIGLLYIISGFGANILSALFLQFTISVGASGALFGILGAMLSELFTNWTIYAHKFAALLTLVLVVLVNLAVGILPHVDNFAHLGGFITGFLLGFVLLIRPQYGWVSRKHYRIGHASRPVKSKYKTYQLVLWVVAALVLIAGLTIGVVLVLKGANGNDYCSWCHYLSCFPTSKWSCEPKQILCESLKMGDKFNLTCTNNGRSHVYPLDADYSSRIRELCTQLLKIGLSNIISGYGANLLSALFLQSTISVGAWGALFGLLGAMLSELFTNWTIYANKELMAAIIAHGAVICLVILPLNGVASQNKFNVSHFR